MAGCNSEICVCVQVYTDPVGTIDDLGEVVSPLQPLEGHIPLHA